jgi:hypothetical protein
MWIKPSSGMFVPHRCDAGALSFEQDEMFVPGHFPTSAGGNRDVRFTPMSRHRQRDR